MGYRVSALATLNVRFTVNRRLLGAITDPTALTVQFAFLPLGTDPGPSDWKAGTWETVTGPPVQYVARCLVGPTGGVVTLARGEYVIWLKVLDTPETFVKAVGGITIT